VAKTVCLGFFVWVIVEGQDCKAVPEKHYTTAVKTLFCAKFVLLRESDGVLL
jgi:hypothetical protein